MSGVVNWVDKNIVQPVINNPVAVLVDVGLMAMGVPPVYAAMAGAGANTAVKGGSAEDIVKSALVGGATAYVGGQVAQSVGNAGYGQGLSGAAGGAAGGATAAALTGGNILQSALTGGAVGGAIGGTMQYFAGSGAVNPAAEGSKMTRAEYAASIPDNVLEAALNTSDPVGYVNKEMGFTGQGTSAGGVNDALADYKMASTPARMPTTSTPVTSTPLAPVAPVAPPMSIDSALAIANAPGIIDPLGSLIQSMGWSPGTSITAATQVADKFAKQTADQVAKSRMDQLNSQQQSNMKVRVEPLMTEANNNANIDNIMSKSPDRSSVIKNLGWSDNQYTQEAAQRLIDNYKAESYAGQQLANQQADYIKSHMVTPPPTPVVAPVEPTITPQPVPVTYNANGGIDLGPVSPETAALTPQQVNQQILQVSPEIAALTPQQVNQQLNIPVTTPVAPTQVTPPNTVDVGGGNYMDQQGNIVDSNGNITQPAVVPGPASPPTVNADTPFKVDVSGSAGFAENPNPVKTEFRSPNTDLATLDQINDGTAQYNAQANAWEVEAGPPRVVSTEQVVTGDGTPYILTHFSDGSFTQQLANQPAPQPVNTGSGSAVVTPQVPTVPSNMYQQPYVDPNPNAVVTPGNNTGLGPVANVDITGGNVATPVYIPPQGPAAGDGSAVVRPQVPIDTSSTITPGTTQTEQPLLPLVPTELTPRPPVENISAGGPTTPDTVIHNPAPQVVIPQPTTPTTPGSSTHYGTYSFGTGPQLNIPQGLNPGYIQPTDFYNTNSPVQSHYYWGGHPYQPGPTFNQALYNNVPNAPGTPWGLQQSFNPNYVYPVAP